MSQLVCNGALLQCTFGVAPSTLASANPVLLNQQPAASIMDFAPLTNIQTFGMCMSLANPEVAAATAAALGVLTPMPCVPNTTAPWTPGSPSVLIAGNPALDASCMCSCAWGGEISITDPGQQTVTDS